MANSRHCQMVAIVLPLLAHIACFPVGFASGFVSAPAVRDDRRSRDPLLASSTTTDVLISSSFWNDAERVARLPDPPSAERLKLIQEKPYRGGFEPAIDVEEPYEPKIVQGRIPSDLVGTLASNGAGRIRVGDAQFGHWFDGDGYVSCISFNGKENQAVFNGRYIRTSRFLAQEKLMEDMRRNHADENDLANPSLAFSGAWTKKGRGRWYENVGVFPTSPANTATMWLKGDESKGSEAPRRLFALCEGGHPIEVDPQTLEVVQDERPFASSDGSTKLGSFFSAHFKRCPMTGDIYNHGFLIRPGPLQPEMNVMRLSAEGNLLSQAKSQLPFDCLIHDSAMTSNYMIFILPPLYIPPTKVFSLISGAATLGNMLEWHGHDEKAYIHIVSKDDLKTKFRIELPEMTSLYHTCDAYEERGDDGSTILRVRIAEHDSMDREKLEEQFSDQYRVSDKRINANLVEYLLSLDENGKAGRFIDKCLVAEDAALCEFPVVNAEFEPEQRRRYIWTNALSDPLGEWLDGIQKVDAKQGTASEVVTFGPGTFAGPPTFVPSKSMLAEDDGYILTTVYVSKEHRSDVVILDAASLVIVCRLELRDHLPFQFHSEYLADYISNSAL